MPCNAIKFITVFSHNNFGKKIYIQKINDCHLLQFAAVQTSESDVCNKFQINQNRFLFNFFSFLSFFLSKYQLSRIKLSTQTIENFFFFNYYSQFDTQDSLQPTIKCDMIETNINEWMKRKRRKKATTISPTISLTGHNLLHPVRSINSIQSKSLKLCEH